MCEIIEESEDSESDEDDDESGDENDVNEEFQLRDQIQNSISKLRKYVTMFNKSADKQQKLQKYVFQPEGKEIRLIHDVKHRWSSLSKMLENFIRIHKCVNHALIDCGLTPFTDHEITILSNLSKTLKPLDVAIKELGKDSASLLELEGVIIFLMNNLEKINNPLATDLVNRLKLRINERRSKVLNTLMLFLNSGNFPASTHFLKYSTKSETKEFANELFSRLFHVDNSLNNSDEDLIIEEESVVNENILLSELSCSINNIKNLKNKKNNNNIDDDLIYLEKSKKRTEKLDMLFNALLTISPTSTISERVFSKSGFIKTKTKNRLKAKKLNHILFLKDYFNRTD